jgi:hypothetical protein
LLQETKQDAGFTQAAGSDAGGQALLQGLQLQAVCQQQQGLQLLRDCHTERLGLLYCGTQLFFFVVQSGQQLAACGRHFVQEQQLTVRLLGEVQPAAVCSQGDYPCDCLLCTIVVVKGYQLQRRLRSAQKGRLGVWAIRVSLLH